MYPFYYVSLVRDKNTHAYNRLFKDYNISGYPTVFFDGGYSVNVGAYTSVPQQVNWYKTSINACGNRAVSDIDVNLLVEWLGSATMDIEVSVQNNETSDYDGHIRVYVTEISSSMGWYDTWGEPYTFAFLDYAFNEDIYINAGDTWLNSTTWDGNTHNDGHGHDFGGITPANIMIIAAVFNAEWHQGYSDPPNGNPFDAYYVDEAAAAWINLPPNTPSDPIPEDAATCVDVDADLSWTGGDPNIGDTVTYDVYFGTSASPPLVSSNQSTTTYDPGTMISNTTYYWKIVARDNHNTSTTGPVWSFTTAICGDVNDDGNIDLSDVIYLANYLLKSGDPPPDPICRANASGDTVINLSDVIYLANYKLKGGPAPHDCGNYQP